jgi:hypothetical protein
LKAEVNSSSRGQKDFCREEKREAAWGYAVGPRNWWSHGSGWILGFIAFFKIVSLVQTDVSCEGEVSLWLIITFWYLLQFYFLFLIYLQLVFTIYHIRIFYFKETNDQLYLYTQLMHCLQTLLTE